MALETSGFDMHSEELGQWVKCLSVMVCVMSVAVAGISGYVGYQTNVRALVDCFACSVAFG